MDIDYSCIFCLEIKSAFSLSRTGRIKVFLRASVSFARLDFKEILEQTPRELVLLELGDDDGADNGESGIEPSNQGEDVSEGSDCSRHLIHLFVLNEVIKQKPPFEIVSRLDLSRVLSHLDIRLISIVD